MFSRHHRKARLLFGLSDILLTAVAFEAAYQTRLWLPVARDFYLTVPNKALLLGFSIVTSLLAGYWLEVYDRLDAAHPRVILRDTFRQCFASAICLVLFQFLLRLDLSRAFLVLFASYSWMGLCLFRLRAGAVVGLIRREFAGPHFVMIVGVGPSALRIAELLERS
ncbi:MAG: sugar transferase, partial [Bryobacteraceae bacterium]